MKLAMNRIISFALVMSAALLMAGCDNPHTPLTERTKETFDMGSVPLKGRPGYSLHGYRLVNNLERDHFVYFLEKDGTPVSGTDVNYEYKSGKSTHVQTISSQISPEAAKSIADSQN